MILWITVALPDNLANLDLWEISLNYVPVENLSVGIYLFLT